MIAEPAITPTTNAHCCLDGVASTNCPVLRSCRLLLAIAATVNTTAVTSRANATSPFSWPASICDFSPNTSSSAAPITTKIPIPDSGLLDEPIKPAI